MGAGAACELSGTRRGLEASRGHAAAECLQPPGAGAARSALGARHLRGIREVERNFGGGGIALAVVDLQAVQDDFLEPIGHGGAHGARRRRIEVQPPAKLRQRARPAEWEPARRERVEQRAQREEVAARIAADAEDLLRRHVLPVADRGAHLLGKQIGIMAVVREAEIDERRFAAGAIQHVGRLEVEVDHVLPVDLVQRERELRAERGHLVGRARRLASTPRKPSDVR